MTDRARAKKAGLFDIRFVIGGLIGLYGVILVLLGLFNATDEELARGDGMNINLWGGIGMVVVAIAVRRVGQAAAGRGARGRTTGGILTGNIRVVSTPEETPASYRYTSDLAGDIERRWQDRWDAEGTFEAPNPVGDLAGDVGSGEKYFIMDMFPYPSGAGLHVGHPLGYIATDVVGRFRRMQGDNVLHALGYDAFGLPAEIHAVQTGEHPRTTTEANIANMRRQLRRLGLAHDPRRSFATIDPDFVRWTQWIFLQIFESWYDERGRQRARPISELRAEYESGELHRARRRAAGPSSASSSARILIDSHRLAYVDESPVNWCPGLGTVLANEEVTADGRSERGNFPVFTRNLRQWKMRITAYSDRLIDDLERIDWPESVKNMQRNWIGRSHGARVGFAGARRRDRRRLHDPPRHAVRRDVRRARPRARAGRRLTAAAWPDGTTDVVDRRSAHARRGGRGVPRRRPRPRPTSSARPDDGTATRPACSPARTRPTRSTASRCRCSSPTTS